MTVRSLSLLEQARLFSRLAGALPGYLRDRLVPSAAHAEVRHDLARRAQNLIAILVDGVLARPQSPYRALLRQAGVGLDDVVELVEREGIEGALGCLYDAGVYVSLDEFKGRKPIVRGSLRLEVAARDFDNPLAKTHYAARSGGSRGDGTRITIDLAHNGRSAVYDFLLLETHGLLERPYVVWQPALPYGAGVNALLRYVRFGWARPRWFSQSPVPMLGKAWQHGLLTQYIVVASRRQPPGLPGPEHVPLANAERIAAHLAELRARGTPAVVNTNASSGTRVCLAAVERGLDIAGTVFRLGGEPLTPARARTVAAAGCRALAIYGMGEIGRIGLPCAHSDAIDDVHVLTDKLAVIRRARGIGPDRPPVTVNVYTTLVPSTPKLMFNVESDDFGELGERACDCPLERLGLRLHLHTIRSHEKLTSEGMNFLGHDLIGLVEEVLPQSFGGAPTDYQFIEDELPNGLPRVRLLVSPRVGEFDAGQVSDAVIAFLNQVPGASDRFGERWREAGTLEVVRAEPIATSASKVLALHTAKPKRERVA